MLYYSTENEDGTISPELIRKGLVAGIESAGQAKPIMIIPPDITRFHSGAGRITEMIWKEYGARVKDILPALGTHRPMTGAEISMMYGAVPEKLFRVHDCRKDTIRLGTIPASFIKQVSEGRLDYELPVRLNKLISEHEGSLIISVGQVVPHEVTGMANYNKNVFIGCGGYESINKSHYLGAVYGMERLIGKPANPVREVINHADRTFAGHLDILYILTVIAPDAKGRPGIKGLYIGSDSECFMKASALSARLNIKILEKAPEKILVFLNPDEYRSTWLGNKAIYRTRMAIADKGELIIIAPGIREFGEDKTIDRLIRKYGYRPPGDIMELAGRNADLGNNLGVAAHLIHGSTAGRFSVCYCTEKLDGEEILKAGFRHMGIDKIKMKYDLNKLREGFNINRDGEEFYYISNPGLGLWAERNRIRL
ncbi:MAG: DUF2088 domain-containing protein [Bacteroidales bacterium]|nr:DUF2088 domain-containing protein [Bacteroidales bacterium]